MSVPDPTVLIRVEGLRKTFPVRLGAYGETRAVVQAVDSVTFDIRRGETLSLVGESGCGKSTVGFSILQLHKPTAGSVTFEGQDLTQQSEEQLRVLRRRLQIVFQDPYSTLNPRMPVGNAIAEPIRHHRLASGAAVDERVRNLLDDVGLSASFVNRFPHELSGGQRQRVVIARALACNPEFLVCDEAISALDVSVQAQVINLLQDLAERYRLTYLFIAHDLAVVRHISQRVGVMYLGRLAELAPRDDLFAAPLHPYTQALLSAVPEPDPERERRRKRAVIRGEVPSPIHPPSGCFFHTRCPIAVEKCSQVVPNWRETAPGHWVACHLVDSPLNATPQHQEL